MDDDNWVVGLVLLIFAPVIILLWLIWELRYHILFFLAIVAGIIWKIHLALGQALVIVIRDWPLRLFWRDEYSDQTARTLIVFWLAGVPFLLLLTLFVAASFSPLVNFLLMTGARFLTFPSIGAILYGYYHYYFTGPITHHCLTRFVKEQHLIKAEAQLAWVGLSTRIKLWFLERVG